MYCHSDRPNCLEKQAERNFMKSAKGSAKSCTSEGTIPCSTTGSETSVWKSALQKKIWVWMDTELTKSQRYVLAAAKKVNSLLGFMTRSLASRLNTYSLLFRPVRHIWSVGSSSEIPSGRKTWTYWSKSSKGSQNLRYWSICPTKQNRELAVFSLKKKKFRSIVSMCINTWLEEGNKTEPDSSQWCTMTRAEAMGTNGNKGTTL